MSDDALLDRMLEREAWASPVGQATTDFARSELQAERGEVPLPPEEEQRAPGEDHPLHGKLFVTEGEGPSAEESGAVKAGRALAVGALRGANDTLTAMFELWSDTRARRERVPVESYVATHPDLRGSPAGARMVQAARLRRRSLEEVGRGGEQDLVDPRDIERERAKQAVIRSGVVPGLREELERQRPVASEDETKVGIPGTDVELGLETAALATAEGLSQWMVQFFPAFRALQLGRAPLPGLTASAVAGGMFNPDDPNLATALDGLGLLPDTLQWLQSDQAATRWHGRMLNALMDGPIGEGLGLAVGAGARAGARGMADVGRQFTLEVFDAYRGLRNLSLDEMEAGARRQLAGSAARLGAGVNPADARAALELTAVQIARGLRRSQLGDPDLYDRAKAHLRERGFEPPPVGPLHFPDAGGRLRRLIKRRTGGKTGRSGKNWGKGFVLTRTPGPDDPFPNLTEWPLDRPTLPQWQRRVEAVLSPEEIAEARTWYSSIKGVFDETFGPEEGPTYMTAWLLSNQNVDPMGALRNALRVSEQVRSGAKGLQGGLSDEKVRQLFSGSRPEKGIGAKLHDFVDSALGRWTRTVMGDTEEGGFPVVVDVHTGRDGGLLDGFAANRLRLLFGSEQYDALVAQGLQEDLPIRTSMKQGKLVQQIGAPSELQYEDVADWMRGLTEQLNALEWQGGGWSPHEAQAVGWTAVAKVMGSEAFSAQASVRGMTRRLAFKLDPGEGAPVLQRVPEWNDLDPDAKATITREVGDRVAEIAGELTGTAQLPRVHGVGGWLDYPQPAVFQRVISSEEGAEDMANMIGYLAQQTEVWAVSPSRKGGANAIAIDVFVEGADDPAQARRIWNALLGGGISSERRGISLELQGFQQVTDTVPGGGERAGIRVLFLKPKGLSMDAMRSMAVEELGPKMSEVLSGMDVENDVVADWSRVVIARNDWTEAPNGEGYLSRLQERYGEEAVAQLRDRHGPELEALIEQRVREHLGAAAGADGAPGEASLEIDPRLTGAAAGG